VATGSFNVPSATVNSTYGSHTVTITAGQAATTTYSITPAINLSATSGVANTTVTVSGTGFAASSSPLTVKFNNSTAGVNQGGTSTTDTHGAFSGTTFTVPNDVPGPYTVSVTDSSSNQGSTTYTINNPSITITSSASGPVGSTVTVSGSNFPASQSLSATFGSTSVTVSGTTSTSSTGSFSGATFTVPSGTTDSTYGAHTVTFTAETQSAPTSYSITPSLVLTPSTGTVGS